MPGPIGFAGRHASNWLRKVGAKTHCEARGEFGKLTGTLGITALVASVDGDHTELHFETNKAGIQKS